MSNTQTLTSLGSGVKREAAREAAPRADWLETFENPHRENQYVVPFVQTRDEFTSLCPKTGQPDHARLEIIYVPRDLMVESKTLKEYLVSYRNHGEFHEDCINRISNDLFDLLKPQYIRVFGDFAPRGGLAIQPMVEKWSSVDLYYQIQIRELVKAWDAKR